MFIHMHLLTFVLDYAMEVLTVKMATALIIILDVTESRRAVGERQKGRIAISRDAVSS